MPGRRISIALKLSLLAALAALAVVWPRAEVGEGASLNPAAYFEDEFCSADPGTWSFASNGYLDPSVFLTDCYLQLGQTSGGVTSLDFPYVRTLSTPLPDSGDFSLEIRAQYPVITKNLTNLAVLGPNDQLIFVRWPDGSTWLRNGGFTTVPVQANVWQRYRLTVTQNQISLSVDGAPVLDASLDVRPSKLWFGHPTIGQVLGRDADDAFPGFVTSCVDPNTGVVSCRWWGPNVWSALRVDYVRVTAACDNGTADPDGDGLTSKAEFALETDACVVDTDQDGCGDGREVLTQDPALGGQRNPKLFWDFFDVPTPPAFARDRAVGVADIAAVVARFGSSGDRKIDPLSTPAAPPAYHTGYDRSVPGDPNTNKSRGPNGSVTVQDIALVVSQFGHSCL
jgi:hypothetical protein